MSHWMITIEGREQHMGQRALMEPTASAPTLTEISHALATINRFTGHATRPYSVAEHSLLVADLMRAAGQPVSAQLAGLMHDAHEAFVGDISSPVKWELGTPWQQLERPHAYQVRKQFGLLTAFAAHRDAVDRFDLVALATERRDLTVFRPGINSPWLIIDTPGREVSPADSLTLNSNWREATPWHCWRDAFAVRFHTLRAELQTC